MGKIDEYLSMCEDEMSGNLEWLVPILSMSRLFDGGSVADCPASDYLDLCSATDAAIPGWRKPKKKLTLVEHDAIFHKDGFNPKTDRCKYREDIARESAPDSDIKNGKSARGGGTMETVRIGGISVPKQLLREIEERDGYRAKDPEWEAHYKEMEEAVAEDMRRSGGGVMEFVPDKTATFLKQNQAYEQGSIDFVDICVKRELALQVLTDILRDHRDLEFNGQDLQAIADELKKRNLSYACTACFVEHRRQHLGWVCRQFIDACRGDRYSRDTSKKGNPRKKMGPKQNAIMDELESEIGKDELRRIASDMTIYDIAVPEGNLEFFARDPNAEKVYRAFYEFNKARGNGSQQLFDHPTSYRGELKKGRVFYKSGSHADNAKVSVTDDWIEKVKNLGGLRFWSKSDFDARFMKDVMAIVKDASDLGLTAQSYTKRDDFAWLMRNTGVKVLRSGIPLGKGYEECEVDDPHAVEVDGKYYRLVFDPVEGIDFNDPNVMDSSGHPDIGCNVIGVNELQMRIAQKDPRIAQVIPLHGTLTPGLERMKEEHGWEMPGYEYEWNTKTQNGKSEDVTEKHGVNFYTEVLRPLEREIGAANIDERKFVERYLKVCEKRHVQPRCPYGLEKRNGKYVYTPGYSKYLADGKFFDYRPGAKFGEYLPMKVVQPNFDVGEIHKAITRRAGELRANARRKRKMGEYAKNVWNAIEARRGNE